MFTVFCGDSMFLTVSTVSLCFAWLIKSLLASGSSSIVASLSSPPSSRTLCSCGLILPVDERVRDLNLSPSLDGYLNSFLYGTTSAGP